MPLYDYKCEVCGEKFEVIQSINKVGTKVKCPKCGATETHVVISSFAKLGSSRSCSPSPMKFG